MKRKILKTLSLMIAMTLLLTSLPTLAGAANDGQMSISVGNGYGDIVFSAYLLARGDYGDWTTVNDFDTIKITSRDDGSAWIDKSMTQIKSQIRRFNLKPVQSATTDASGKALFTGLEHGIYFVQATNVPARHKIRISPMLLSTPDKENKLNIIANAKSEPIKTTDDDDDEDDDDDDDGGDGIVGSKHFWPQVKLLSLTLKRGERLTLIDEYETALGLGNIQIHVGVCYE